MIIIIIIFFLRTIQQHLDLWKLNNCISIIASVGHKNSDKILVPRVVSMAEEPIIVSRPHA